MNMTLKRQVLFAALLAVGGVGGVSAAPPAEPGKILAYEEALDVDAGYLAKSAGLSKAEARSWLNVEMQSGEIVERVRKQYAARLAGVYIEHEPTHRLVVRLTGHEAVRPEFHHFGADTLEVAFVPGAEHTFAELQRQFDSGLRRLQAAMPAVQGGYVDERTGEAVIEVLRDESSAKSAALSLKDALGAPVRLVELDEPNELQAVFGSGRLTFAGTGGNFVCTNGFVVQHAATSSTGVLTAGHCQATLGLFTYLGVDAAIHALGSQASTYNSTADIQWLSAGNTAGYGPWFYADAWRQLTGRRTQASTSVGNQICKYGTNGGYGCGTVYSVAYNPGASCGPTGSSPCSATFVGVQGAANICLGGDSGGPWFISTVATGVHRGGNPAAGTCSYTSTDRAYSTLGLNLLYGP